MIKILVTGVGGNVGQYVARELTNAGYEIIGIYRNHMPANANYKLIKADIAEKVPEISGVEVIIHIAAGLAGTARKLLNDNGKATENLICFAEYNHIKRFIYISTVSVYGNVENELCESSDIINPDCYGMTKYLCECMVKESQIPEKLIIQLPRMLGPFVDMDGTQDSGFLAMTGKIVRGEDVICHIPEVEYNNYLHVSELEKFLEQLLIKDEWAESQIVLLGAQERFTMMKILQIMKNAIGSNSHILSEHNDIKPKCALINIDRANKMGFCPCNAKSMLERFIKEVCR